MYTDNPIADFNRHDAEETAALERLPKCEYCGEPIQDDFYYDIGGDIMCYECLKDNYRKPVEYYGE